MVHPAISKSRPPSTTVTPGPTLIDINHIVPDDPNSQHPFSSINHLHSGPLSTVQDLQTSLCTLLDMMSPLEFSKTLRFHIQSVLAHWPPCDLDPMSANVSNTTTSVMGLVSLFIPPIGGHHNLSAPSISDLHGQLQQVEILLTFLSVSELMQVCRSRIEKAQMGPVGRPNVLLGVLDVIRSKFVAVGYINGEASQNLRVCGNAHPRTVSENTRGQLDPCLVHPRDVSEAPHSASQPAEKASDGCQETRKKAKVDLGAYVDENSGQHLLPIHPVEGALSVSVYRTMSQERTGDDMASDAIHPTATPSSHNIIKYNSPLLVLTPNEGRPPTAKSARWREPSHKADNKGDDLRPAQAGPLPSLCKVVLPSLDGEDNDLSDNGEAMPFINGSLHSVPSKAFVVDACVAEEQNSNPLSPLAKIPRQSILTSKDTLTVLDRMEEPSISTKASTVASSASQACQAMRPPRQ